MNPLALAIIGQLRAIGDAATQVHWRTDELQAMADLLYRATGNVERNIANRNVSRAYPEHGGAA
jgi:hypothetical protein